MNRCAPDSAGHLRALARLRERFADGRLADRDLTVFDTATLASEIDSRARVVL